MTVSDWTQQVEWAYRRALSSCWCRRLRVLGWQQRRYSLVAKRTVESTGSCRGECEDGEYAAGSPGWSSEVEIERG